MRQAMTQPPPPRNLKLTVSATAGKGSSCTLNFAAKFDLVFKTSAIYIYTYVDAGRNVLCGDWRVVALAVNVV